MAMKLGDAAGAFTGEDPQPEVHISVDKFAKYAKVAETLADLQSRGLKKIGFINNELFVTP
jgi:biopolymer transport protein ExbD